MKSEQMPGAGFPAPGIKHLGDRKLVILMTVRKSSPATAQEIINNIMYDSAFQQLFFI